MAQIASNADTYAIPRQNQFFSGVVPSLDGQCVSLVKWFMQEMTGVPNPQAARGDARYVGKTLVSQGHAVEVPHADRRRGDIICYEYGTYGHIGVQLSGGRVFEQNVNLGGVASKIVDGARVYASRIGSENESFRRDVHVYRVKSYNESGGVMDTVDRGGLETIWKGFLDRAPMESEYKEFVGKSWPSVLHTAYTSPEYKNRYAGLVKNYNIVTYEVPKLNQRIKELEESGAANPKAVALYNAVREAVK